MRTQKTTKFGHLASFICVTVAVSTLILKEPLTPALVSGTLLALSGLWLSETRFFERSRKAPAA